MLWSGFGNRIGRDTGNSVEATGALLRHSKEWKLLLIPRAGILPFPTIPQPVSGKNMRRVHKQKPDSMTKNQKTHGQPSRPLRSPPKTGPKTGATFGL